MGAHHFLVLSIEMREAIEDVVLERNLPHLENVAEKQRQCHAGQKKTRDLEYFQTNCSPCQERDEDETGHGQNHGDRSEREHLHARGLVVPRILDERRQSDEVLPTRQADKRPDDVGKEGAVCVDAFGEEDNECITY